MRLIRILLSLLAAVHASMASAEETYRWIQYVDGGLEARAITNAPACPDATRNGAQEQMSVRVRPDEAFPVRVCVLRVPNGTKDVVVGGVPLALPKPSPRRILLIGDTGCRIKGERAQPCGDREAWPFQSIADLAAQMNPDLVIHVGDYYYRESKCPLGQPGCAGSPSGDGWDSWRADFFAPAGRLLSAAPWVFVRGNHEKCGRGGEGWSRLLDAFRFRPGGRCKEFSPSFTANVGGVKVVVVDVAAVDENEPDQGLARFYRSKFSAVGSLKGHVWLAFHQPIWSPNGERKDGTIHDGNKTLALAARRFIPSNVQAMLSGHIHTFEVMSYTHELPVQIVSGNGGDELECAREEGKCHRLVNFDGLRIGNVKIKTGRGVPNSFGFAMLERHRDHWAVAGHDAHANMRMTCRMRGRAINCD
jgi:predicted phosphodiesterase